MIALYWLIARFSCKKPNYLLFPLIFIIAYIALAWYDVGYNCSDRLYSGKGLGTAVYDSIFKDQLRDIQHAGKDTVLDQERIYQRNVHFFHILMIVPVLLYVGIRGKLTDNNWYTVLIVFALGSFVYHGYRIFQSRQTCNIITDDKGNIESVNKGNLPK